eukprot:scaffold3100_cov203-Alexandrium_tamarense.AAC.23
MARCVMFCDVSWDGDASTKTLVVSAVYTHRRNSYSMPMSPFTVFVVGLICSFHPTSADCSASYKSRGRNIPAFVKENLGSLSRQANVSLVKEPLTESRKESWVKKGRQA